MKKELMKHSNTEFYGDLSGVSGDLTGVRGDLSGVYGDLDKCELADIERAGGVDIEDLVG